MSSADLRTFSLFATGKVVAVVESGVFADRATAATLFDEVRPAAALERRRRRSHRQGARCRDATAAGPPAVRPRSGRARLRAHSPGAAGARSSTASRAAARRAKGAADEVRTGSCRSRGGGRRRPARPRRAAPPRSSPIWCATACRSATPWSWSRAPSPRGIRCSRRSPRREAVAFAGEITAEQAGGFDGLAALASRARARDRRGDRSRRARGARAPHPALRGGLRRRRREIDARLDGALRRRVPQARRRSPAGGKIETRAGRGRTSRTAARRTRSASSTRSPKAAAPRRCRGSTARSPAPRIRSRRGSCSSRSSPASAAARRGARHRRGERVPGRRAQLPDASAPQYAPSSRASSRHGEESAGGHRRPSRSSRPTRPPAGFRTATLDRCRRGCSRPSAA